MPDNYTIPKYILDLAEDYKLMNEWNEKLMLTKCAIETMYESKDNYS